MRAGPTARGLAVDDRDRQRQPARGALSAQDLAPVHATARARCPDRRLVAPRPPQRRLRVGAIVGVYWAGAPVRILPRRGPDTLDAPLRPPAGRMAVVALGRNGR